MEGATKESGSKITWRVWVSTFGMMAEFTKVNTRMIKNTASASTPGLMAGATRATGTEVNSMAWALTTCQRTANRSSVCGRMASVLSGLTRIRYRQST